MDKVRIGIIGFGHMGNQHVNALRQDKVPNAVLAAIADINPAKLEKARALAGDRVKYFSSAEELMDSGEVDAASMPLSTVFTTYASSLPEYIPMRLRR